MGKCHQLSNALIHGDTVANRNATLRLFLTGLGTGFALAIFFAPRSGRASRHIIGRKAQEGTETLTTAAVAGRDYIERQGSELRDRTQETLATSASRGD